MTNGNDCDRIATREDCEAAARALGLSDTTSYIVYPVNGAVRPPSCYYKPGNPDDMKLIFNPFLASTASCSNERNCLCKGNIAPITGKHQFLPLSNVVIT